MTPFLNNPVILAVAYESDDGWGFVCMRGCTVVGFSSRDDATREANRHHPASGCLPTVLEPSL